MRKILIFTLFCVACNSGKKDIDHDKYIKLRNKVWFTYSYYQLKAAREARSSSDTDEAFNKLWEQYNDSVFLRCGVTQMEYSNMLKSKMNEMAELKDWSDNSLNENQCFELMNQE